LRKDFSSSLEVLFLVLQREDVLVVVCLFFIVVLVAKSAKGSSVRTYVFPTMVTKSANAVVVVVVVDDDVVVVSFPFESAIVFN
jgi:hypothetical protein